MQILATPLLEDLFEEMWRGSEDLFEEMWRGSEDLFQDVEGV